MGSTSSQEEKRQEPPEGIAEFRKLGGFRQLDGPHEPFNIPEVPQKRKTTDVPFTIVFGASIAVLLIFLIYTLVHADINRLIHGYDDCGNICGSANAKIDNIPCSGKNETDQPFLRLHPSKTLEIVIGHTIYDYISGECVSSCNSDDVILMNRCYPEDDTHVKKDLNKILETIGEGLSRSAGRIVALCFIGLGFCVMMLLLFRYYVAVTIWFVFGGSTLASIAATVYFWLAAEQGNDDMAGIKKFTTIAYIMFGSFSVVLILLLVCLAMRIKLIIRLFQESMKIIFDMPLILLQPLLTFLASLILGVVFFVLLFWLNTAGNLTLVAYPFYDYLPNGAMAFTIWFHMVICLWFGQFIIGCQQMVIAGAVSAHYFSKDKSTLTQPIYNSFYNLIRYHLGSVAFGSLLITLIVIIKALMRGIVRNRSFRILITCCLGRIESILKYLSKNAYIQTAMHGQPFYTSGKRAVCLLCANAMSAVAVNSVGNFVLFMAKVFIVALTVLVGSFMGDNSNPYWLYGIAIAAIVTAILAHCAFTVFETAVDTLFLCFCEDQCMNDGLTQPYYMSVDFMQYMEETKTQAQKKNCLIR